MGRSTSGPKAPTVPKAFSTVWINDHPGVVVDWADEAGQRLYLIIEGTGTERRAEDYQFVTLRAGTREAELFCQWGDGLRIRKDTHFYFGSAYWAPLEALRIVGTAQNPFRLVLLRGIEGARVRGFPPLVGTPRTTTPRR